MPWIERCLGSLCASGHPVDIYVRDNASDDGTAAYIREHFPQVHLEAGTDNLGFAGANNLGLRYALAGGYDAVYLMNQDAWVEPETLGLLSAASEAHPEFGALSPLQLDASGGYDAQFEKRCRPDLSQPLQEVPFVMAAHLFLTRHCLETVGLFAPVFPFYGEDENYCQRVGYHGLRIGIVTAARAVHDRAERVEGKEKIIYRNYKMASLQMLCDIRHPLFRQQVKVLGYTCVKALRYRSSLPWKHFVELRKMFPEVRRTRAASLQPGAFWEE